MTHQLVGLAWRDLRDSGRTLWIFCACLVLGVTLIAASGGLFSQVRDSLLADTRALFGGDLEVRSRAPLTDAELAWMRAHGAVSLLIELRTMLLTNNDRFQLVELQSFDDAYPLYGTVGLTPDQPLRDAVTKQAEGYGVAIDPVLATRLDLALGDQVSIGNISLTVRALIESQPDRSLRADWRGPPVLLSDAALQASGLLQAGSRVAWRYRVRTEDNLTAWRDAFTQAFPDADWEIRTFAERSERLAEVLGQIGSGLLLIGFSALFIGGLGVFNSIHAYLQGKLGAIATLRSLGLRDRKLAGIYLLQVLLLAATASLVGVFTGGTLALIGASFAAERLPMAPALANLALPLAMAWLFGILTALTFALPALGRALSISPAALFRGLDAAHTHTPPTWWWMTGIGVALITALLMMVIPDLLFGAGFVLVTVWLLVLLEGLVRLLRIVAHYLAENRLLRGRFALRLALANLYRSGSSLRPALLSLGSALTLLVASALVVAALLRTIDETIPERAPALVFYDVPAAEVASFRDLLTPSPSLERVDLAPLVLGRLVEVNRESLRESDNSRRRLEARDEHKLSYRANNFDQVIVERGRWWQEDYVGPPLVAFEDREADQIGLKVGDRLIFDIVGERIEAELVAIYSQRNFQARFWLEGIFSDGVLDAFVSRYVGAAFMGDGDAVAAQARIAGAMPNVVTIRTQGLLDEARALLAKASVGLSVIAVVSLLASLLVLISVVTASRARQIYDATVLYTLGARLAAIRQALAWEYILLALLTTVFSLLLGGAIAETLLRLRLELDTDAVWWIGVVVAILVSICSLGLGAVWLLRQLSLSPAQLLRNAG
jgi:putative ABC transport system permease protein